MVLDTTQQLGWAYDNQTDPWADPINAVDALYWQFGVRTMDLKDLHPSLTQNWEPIYRVNARTPSDMQLPTNRVSGSYAFFPVNGVPLFLILGDSGTAAGVHTVVNINTGSLPTFTVRSESTGGTVSKFLSSTGCKATSLNGYVNTIGNWPFLSETLAYNAINTAASTSLAETHTTGTKYPTDDYTMTGTERTGRYCHTNPTAVCTWNTADIVADFGMLNYSITNTHTISHIDGQADTEFIDEGNYELTLSFACWRGNTNTENLHTDFLAGTQHDFVYKIFNGASYYRQYTWTNVAWLREEMIYAMGEEKKLYTFHGLAEDISIAVVDGVSDTFYED